MADRRVLVTGAGIAGLTASYWLDRAGFDVTVVERSDVPRAGGQNVDVRATAREVLRRMDLEDAVRARNTGEVGTRFVDHHGGTVAEMPVREGEGDGPTAELEILRGALAEVVRDVCPDTVDVRYGDHVVAVDQDDDGVRVRLASGGEERFDLLLVADGVGSSTRELVLADAVEARRIGMTIAIGTVPRTETDDDWWRFASMPGSRQVHLRPDDEGTIRVMLSYLTEEDESDEQILAALRDRFGDLGWEVPRLLDALEHADDLYVDQLTQIHASTWHRGRVALLGDAAWCVTPLGGAGSSLALIGAYVLAARLSQTPDDPHQAFEAYEEWMRPLVKEFQDLPPGVPRIAAPRSRLGLAVMHGFQRVMALPPAQALAAKVFAGPDSAEELPEVLER